MSQNALLEAYCFLLSSCYFCSLGKADTVVCVFLGFEIWRQLEGKEEWKSLEESFGGLGKGRGPRGGGGLVWGSVPGVVSVFQSSEVGL